MGMHYVKLSWLNCVIGIAVSLGVIMWRFWTANGTVLLLYKFPIWKLVT